MGMGLDLFGKQCWSHVIASVFVYACTSKNGECSDPQSSPLLKLDLEASYLR